MEVCFNIVANFQPAGHLTAIYTKRVSSDQPSVCCTSCHGVYIRSRPLFTLFPALVPLRKIISMSYRRARVSRRRYPVRRRRAAYTTKRSTYRRSRKTFGWTRQKRAAPRVSRRMTKKIKNVSAVKKQDTLLMATPSNIPALIPITFSDQERYYLWSPTYRERLDSIESSSRNRTRCYFRGVKERWDVRVDDAGWVHRRVVFWAHLTPSEAVPFKVGTVADNNITYYRPFTPIDPSTSAPLFEYMWKGTSDTDYSAALRYDAKMDNRRLKIVSDKRKLINVGTTRGGIRQYNMWTEINKSIVYDEEESGGQDVTSPWSVVGPNSPGNLFFLDMFYTPSVLSGSSNLTFSSQATVYWHEGGSV